MRRAPSCWTFRHPSMTARLLVLLLMSWSAIVLQGPSSQVSSDIPHKEKRDSSASGFRLGLHDGDEALANRPQLALQLLNQRPIRFEVNNGQTDSRVKFYSRGNGYTLFLTSDEAVLSLAKPSPDRKSQHADPAPTTEVPKFSAPSAVRLKLVGANPKARVSGLDELPGRSNYFIGNDPKKWRRSVAHFAKVKYEGVYPGIDLLYYGRGGGQLEYDFVVAPGADPNAIALSLKGTKKTEIDSTGNMVIVTDAGDVRFGKPVVFQESVQGEERQLVDGHFVLSASNQIRFKTGPYDKSRPLVIDPYVDFVAYLGGSGTDMGGGVAIDAGGNIYVTGYTTSADFPVLSAVQNTYTGSQDAFVAKLNSTGTAILYSTYLGGTLPAGNAYDTGRKIAVDGLGNAYVFGETFSTDLPVVDAIQSTQAGGKDTFLVKLNSAGDTIEFLTYLGGSASDSANDIALDSSNNMYLSGTTSSANFPITVGAFDTTCGVVTLCSSASDAFVTKVSASGSSLVYSTFLGGNKGDAGWDIAVDSGGNAYLTGISYSADFPTTDDAFLKTNPGAASSYCAAVFSKLSSGGTALAYSTYLGGATSYTYGYGLGLDTAGDVYLTGQTSATDFPTTPSAYQVTLPGTYSAFVTKFNMATKTLAYSTYLGGTWAFGRSVTPNGSGEAWVIGYAETGFPTTSDAFQPVCAGGPSGRAYDGFITKLAANGRSLAYSTFFGGSGAEYFAKQAAMPGSACGTGSELCEIVIVGQTEPTNFLVTASNFNLLLGNDGMYHGGGNDAFIMKVKPGLAPRTGVSQISVTYGEQTGGSTSAATPMTVGNFTSAPLNVTHIGVDDPNFTVDPKGCIKTFAVGEKCVVDVYFTPASAEAAPPALRKGTTATGPLTLRSSPATPPLLPSPRGTRTGTLSLTSSVSGDPTTTTSEIPLTGTVMTPLTPTPSSLSFGTQTFGNPTSTQQVTVTNTSTTDLVSLGTIAISGANSGDFLIYGNSCGASLAALAQCTVDVQFSPQAAGPRRSLLAIPDLAYGSSVYTILTGYGAALSVSPADLGFPDQTVNTTSGPMPVNIVNASTKAVKLWQIVIGGLNAGNFSKFTNCPIAPATLEAGMNCMIGVTFTPSALGTRLAVLQMSHDGGASPTSVPLTGNGIAPSAPSGFVSLGGVPVVVNNEDTTSMKKKPRASKNRTGRSSGSH